MTDQQILELANDYLEEWEADEDGRTWIEYSGTSQKLIEFARAIYEMGNENGWESHQESVYLNSSYPTDYNYD